MILIDSDVLVDAATDRQPFSDIAEELLNRIQVERVDAAVSWHSIANFYYVVSPKIGSLETRDYIHHLVNVLTVAPTTNEDVQFALGLAMNDFEDAMQVAAARACRAEFIVTRNLRDFRASPVPAISPPRALVRLF